MCRSQPVIHKQNTALGAAAVFSGVQKMIRCRIEHEAAAMIVNQARQSAAAPFRRIKKCPHGMLLIQRDFHLRHNDTISGFLHAPQSTHGFLHYRQNCPVQRWIQFRQWCEIRVNRIVFSPHSFVSFSKNASTRSWKSFASS